VSNTYFGASGATLAEFLKSVGDAAIPFPRSVQVSSASPAASAPSPTIPAAPPAKPVRLDEALNALNGFDRMARCATCKGSGTTTKVVEVGRRGTGVVTQPIKERQSVTCSTCSGVGFRTGTSINRATKRFADAAAALDRATDGIERFDRRVTTLFRDLAEDNSAGAAQALADFAAHETPALGEGIVGAGNIHTRVGFEVPNADGALVIGLPNQRIAVIRSFALRETAGNGPIFFVGAFAGRTTLDSGTELIVVDRAYVVRAKD
jgi:hypothetical protein